MTEEKKLDTLFRYLALLDPKKDKKRRRKVMSAIDTLTNSTSKTHNLMGVRVAGEGSYHIRASVNDHGHITGIRYDYHYETASIPPDKDLPMTVTEFSEILCDMLGVDDQ